MFVLLLHMAKMLGKTFLERKTPGGWPPENYREMGIFYLVLRKGQEWKQQLINIPRLWKAGEWRRSSWYSSIQAHLGTPSPWGNRGRGGSQSVDNIDPLGHQPRWAVVLKQGAQRLTSVISSCDQPMDHKEHISKQIQKTVSDFSQGVLVIEVFTSHRRQILERDMLWKSRSHKRCRSTTMANTINTHLCRYDSECFTHIVSFNPHSNPMMQISKLAPFHRLRNWGLERWSGWAQLEEPWFFRKCICIQVSCSWP